MAKILFTVISMAYEVHYTMSINNVSITQNHLQKIEYWNNSFVLKVVLKVQKMHKVKDAQGKRRTVSIQKSSQTKAIFFLWIAKINQLSVAYSEFYQNKFNSEL